MLSFGSHLALSNPSMFHSFVDSFFEGKKALVKERLMDSVKVIVDGLFEEMVGQVKEMMLPLPKNDQVKPSCFDETFIAIPVNKTSTKKSPVKTKTVLPVSQPPSKRMFFATKSKPGPSTSAQQPQFSGLYKRMAEEDGGGSNSQPNKKKKAVTVELEITKPFDDEENDIDDMAIYDAEGDIDELANNNAHHFNVDIATTSNEGVSEKQQQIQSEKFPCTEPNCGKRFPSNSHLKRHLLTHTKVKPYGCTFPGCSSEFGQRPSAIRHIFNVHLKKKKPDDADKEVGGEGDDNSNEEPPDPATYLSVKEELL